MHINDFDLNLLRYLDALLATRSVSAAAARMGLSQPAMSRALARLREHLNDPLLVRSGARMSATPRALELEGPVRELLEQATAVVRNSAGFEPATASRRFAIAMTDYAEALLLAPLLERLRREAPGVDISVTRAAWIQQVSGEFDLVLVPRSPTGAGVIWTRAFEDEYACLVRRAHPRVKRRLTARTYAALPHLMVAPGGRPGSFVDEALAEHGLERRVALTLPGFLVVPTVVAQSDLIATIPSRLARTAAAGAAVKVVPAPLPFPPLTLSLGWPERLHRDPGHRWFRGVIADLCAESS
ncbi:MAG: LysR family transcriptional regulator [Haliangiales bacterium]